LTWQSSEREAAFPGRQDAGRRYHLGIDIGGTFTDLSLLDRQTGQVTSLKTPTLPDDPARGVANGLALLTERGVSPAEIDYFVHGTTIGVNTIIQRSGARIALFATEGFRDVLEMARLRLPTPWDFYGQRPQPLLPRELVVPVRERTRHNGSIETPLTAAEIERVISELDGLAINGVAICLLHSYANPAHESALKAALGHRAPHLFVSASAEIWPQMREYERALVTVMNAYVQPPLVRYLDALETTLREHGVTTRTYLTRSNGGIMTTTMAKEHPVQTLLSGPASGVVGAVAEATRAGFGDLITFDMGGTSADVALVTGGQIEFSREAHVGDFPLSLPVVGLSSIGAGGGSIAWLDGAGVLKVGPRSAGADPGPACYGLGGKEATLTDAFLLCGYLNPDRFAGKVRLDATAASAAVEKIADPLGLGVSETASAIVRVALATMYTEFSAFLERRGIDPRDFILVASGGAGPVVACQLADEVNVTCILAPPTPGTLAALGARHAEAAADFIRSVHWRLDDPISAAVSSALADLQAQSVAWLEQEAPSTERSALHWTADMRYVGQSHEIETPLRPEWLNGDDVSPLANAFHSAHQRIFTYADPEAIPEMVNLRVRAIGEVATSTRRFPDPAHVPTAVEEARQTLNCVVETSCPPYVARMGGDEGISQTDESAGQSPQPIRTRSIALNGAWYEATIYQRDSLRPGQSMVGPVIVEQPDTTIIVPPGWRAAVHTSGNLVIERKEAR
jgi:N-methylhydantoinase A